MVILMLKINKEYENTIIINKSEFITHLYRVNSVDEVNEILAKVRKKYYDATHNCYAYIIGDNAEIQKASDDGEPQKTAGMPMIDVLKKNNLTNILAITTRYFGGILLGAGGLVRAYSSSVSECLKNVELYDTKNGLKLQINLNYQEYNSFIKLPYIKIIDQSFTEDVNIIFLIDENNYDTLIKDLQNRKIELSINQLGTEIIEYKVKKI